MCLIIAGAVTYFAVFAGTHYNVFNNCGSNYILRMTYEHHSLNHN
jgi:hypothetical protein